MGAREWVFLLLGILVFCSYQPLVYLGYGRGTNYEVSLLQIGLVVLIALSVRRIWEGRRELAKDKVVWLVGAFALLSSISLLWTLNKTRGVLAAGLVWVVFLTMLTIRGMKDKKKLLVAFVKVLMVGAVASSIFAWWQVAGEAFGVGQAWTLLSDNYLSGLFGFARPTGLAQEPQFFAAHLVFPVLLLMYRVLVGKVKRYEKWILILLLATVVATLSRGAILAVGAGVLILFVQNRGKRREIGKACLYGLAGSVLAFGMMGIAAQINNRNEVSAYTAIAKSLNQFTLGVVKLPETKTDRVSTEGYVEASTKERTTMSDLALKTIRSGLTTAVFGVGIGGAGFYYHNKYQCVESCINFNEYLDVAVEIGAVGLVIWACAMGGLFVKMKDRKYLRAVLAAYLVQWMFYAGYPNSLPVLVMIVVMYGMVLVGKERLEYESN